MQYILSPFKSYDMLWQAIIRPPRMEYTMNDLGPSIFYVNNKMVEREDFQI